MIFLWLIFAFSFPSLATSHDEAVGPLCHDQFENIYKSALISARLCKAPLISKLSELNLDHPELSALVKLAFSRGDFDVRDAHWAIVNFLKEQRALDLMLENRDFENYLTESFNSEGNLLYHCLFNEFQQAFDRILKAFPILEANPGVTCFTINIGTPFREAKKLFAKDPSIPLIAYLAINFNSSVEKWIDYGLFAKKFSTADIKWVVEEFSKPQMLNKPMAERIFHSIFAPDLTAQQKEFVLELITSVALPKESSLMSSTKYWLGGHSYSEHHNLVIHCIEHGYLSAFKEILEVFPELIELFDTAFVTRKEQEKTSSWFSYYNDESYNLISWLMRPQNDKPAAYVEVNSMKPFYLQACQIIAKQFMVSYDPNNPQKEIDPQLFELIAKVTRVDKELSQKLEEKE